jgi:hypothetical protein
MKNVILTAAIIISSTIANSQSTFGVHANGILASGTNKVESSDPDDENFDLKSKNRFSWKIGVVANIPVSTSISFMPQLNILSKGGKIEEKESNSFYSYEIKGSSKLTYVEMPLNFVYNTGSFFIGAGPSLSFGISGKSEGKVTATVMGETETEEFDGKVKFDGDEDADDDNEHLKAFELGANFTAGYKLTNGLFIQANYNLGLSNISPYENTTTKNRYFGIGIGYFFGSNGNARK